MRLVALLIAGALCGCEMSNIQTSSGADYLARRNRVHDQPG
jgi:hypothetical protein